MAAVVEALRTARRLADAAGVAQVAPALHPLVNVVRQVDWARGFDLAVRGDGDAVRAGAGVEGERHRLRPGADGNAHLDVEESGLVAAGCRHLVTEHNPCVCRRGGHKRLAVQADQGDSGLRHERGYAFRERSPPERAGDCPSTMPGLA